jgi:hypothetical protein
MNISDSLLVLAVPLLAGILYRNYLFRRFALEHARSEDRLLRPRRAWWVKRARQKIARRRLLDVERTYRVTVLRKPLEMSKPPESRTGL